jgi:hypothetical protein
MEIFKDIPEYEGLYQVSNLGRVKSLSKKIWNGKGYFISKERILKPGLSRKYLSVMLSKKAKFKTFKVHQLVAKSFLNHFSDGTNKLVVDHINNIKTDNRLENLQIITQRENSSKDTKGTSKYTGVSWCKVKKKWVSRLKLNGKYLHLGYFHCEIEASNAYQKTLNGI